MKTCAGVVAGILSITVAACSAGDDSADAGQTVDIADAGQSVDSSVLPGSFDGGADFYAPPDPLPEGDHGMLLRFQPLDDEEVVAGATAYRVMYLSESLEGDPIAVTGTVVVPVGEAPDAGWKLVSVAHGTSGNADECAPSKFFGDAPVLALDDPIAAGYVIAVTDYEGLGTPGRHPYLVAESEGRSVIDAALAARQLPNVPVGDRYGIVGYSQGGHAAAGAHDIAAEWAPDLELVGTVSGAPPSETDIVFTGLANGLAGGGNGADLFFLMVAGFAAAYPEADPALVLTDAGLEVLDGVDHGCFAIDEVLGDAAWSDLLRPGGNAAEPWPALLAENKSGQVAADSPMLIVHSADDSGVPAFLSEAMFTRLCDLGQVVERRVYAEGEDHDEAAVSMTPEMFAWIEERMMGEPAISTCP